MTSYIYIYVSTTSFVRYGPAGQVYLITERQIICLSTKLIISRSCNICVKNDNFTQKNFQTQEKKHKSVDVYFFLLVVPTPNESIGI